MYPRAKWVHRYFGSMDLARSVPLTARGVRHAKPSQGRQHENQQAVPARTASSGQHARRDRNPWLLLALPNLKLSARQLVALYARRIQIERSFRGLTLPRSAIGKNRKVGREPDGSSFVLCCARGSAEGGRCRRDGHRRSPVARALPSFTLLHGQLAATKLSYAPSTLNRSSGS